MNLSRRSIAATAACTLLASCGGGGSTQVPDSPVPVMKTEALPSGAPLRAPPLRTASSAELDAEIDMLLDWAQNRFPDLFSGVASSQTFEKYRYRHYPATGNHVGVATVTSMCRARRSPPSRSSWVPCTVTSARRSLTRATCRC